MRSIDADALIIELEKDEAFFDKEAEEARENPNNCTEGYADAMWSRANGIRDAIMEIYNAPIIDIDRPQGKWTNAGILTVHCSNCKSEFHELEAMNFCPNCGADMREKESEL